MTLWEKFNPSSRGLESVLGSLERRIMEALWELGDASVADVLSKFPDLHAYTTVKTVMERLERKGLLTRVKAGRAYMYRPSLSRSELEAQASRKVIEGLWRSFGSAAVAQFAQTLREDPEKLSELRALLEELPSREESVETDKK